MGRTAQQMHAKGVAGFRLIDFPDVLQVVVSGGQHVGWEFESV